MHGSRQGILLNTKAHSKKASGKSHQLCFKLHIFTLWESKIKLDSVHLMRHHLLQIPSCSAPKTAEVLHFLF